MNIETEINELIARRDRLSLRDQRRVGFDRTIKAARIQQLSLEIKQREKAKALAAFGIHEVGGTL